MAPFDDITELAVAAMVERFYSKARRDPLIGPVFNRAIEDWDEHLHKLRDFWSSVMLTSKAPVGTYRGPGYFESNFFRERLMDMAAKDLGVY